MLVCVRPIVHASFRRVPIRAILTGSAAEVEQGKLLHGAIRQGNGNRVRATSLIGCDGLFDVRDAQLRQGIRVDLVRYQIQRVLVDLPGSR